MSELLTGGRDLMIELMIWNRYEAVGVKIHRGYKGFESKYIFVRISGRQVASCSEKTWTSER